MFTVTYIDVLAWQQSREFHSSAENVFYSMGMTSENKESFTQIPLSLSCSMGSMPVGVHDIFHEMGPFIPVHHQCVQIADVLVAPVVSPPSFRSSSLILAIHNSKDDLFYQSFISGTHASAVHGLGLKVWMDGPGRRPGTYFQSHFLDQCRRISQKKLIYLVPRPPSDFNARMQ